MAMKLYVGGLPYATTEDELKAAFEAHGTVVEATIIKDRDTGQSKGFGFVEMDDAEAGKTAIKELDGSDMGGRTIRVSEARPREERPRRSF
jgi:RNA recognition motif-containing protein